MGTFKEDIEQRRKSPAAVFHAFRTRKHNRETLYLFVEGYDDILFLSKVAEKADVEVDFINCFGKKILGGVYELHVKARMGGVRVLFIRDRDFDDHLGRVGESDDFILTAGYSVENYLCDRSSLKKFFVAGMGLSQTEVDFDGELDSYDAALDQFHRASLTMYARIFAAIELSEKVDLDAVDVAPAAQLCLDKQQVSDEVLASLASACEKRLSSPVSCRHMLLARRYLSRPASEAIRGKYLLRLAYIFLRRMFDKMLVAHKSNAISSLNRTVGARLSENSIFELLVGTAPVPKELTDAMRGSLTPATS